MISQRPAFSNVPTASALNAPLVPVLKSTRPGFCGQIPAPVSHPPACVGTHVVEVELATCPNVAAGAAMTNGVISATEVIRIITRDRRLIFWFNKTAYS
jgi:hypothetical protein